jgi:hypothetical protein
MSNKRHTETMTDKEVIRHMASIFIRLPEALETLYEEWRKENNDMEFDIALEEVETMLAQGKALAWEGLKQ